MQHPEPLVGLLRILHSSVQRGQGWGDLPFSALGRLHNRLAFKLLAHSTYYASGPGKELGLLDLA